MPARPIRNDALVPSIYPSSAAYCCVYSSALLRQSIGITSLSSARDPHPIEVLKPHPTRPRVPLSQACVPSGSHRTFRISGPGLWIDCGQYWCTRPGEPRATGTDGALASCRPGPATQTNAIEQPYPKHYWFSAETLKSRGFASAFWLAPPRLCQGSDGPNQERAKAALKDAAFALRERRHTEAPFQID
jgi:hypothetical protein